MELLSYTTFDLIVYVEWESPVNFVTIFGLLYQNKLWGVHMYAKKKNSSHIRVQCLDRMMTSSKWPPKCYLCTYIHKLLDSKHLLCGNFLLESIFCLYLIYLVLSDTTMTCFFFLIPGTQFGASHSIKSDPEPITVLVIP